MGVAANAVGLFMKMVLTDNCEIDVDHVFSNNVECSGATLVLGIFYRVMQYSVIISGIAISPSAVHAFSVSI